MPRRIASLPENARLEQHDIKVAEYNRRFKEDYGCYFTITEDGREVAIWGVVGYVPYNDNYAYEIPRACLLT